MRLQSLLFRFLVCVLLGSPCVSSDASGIYWKDLSVSTDEGAVIVHPFTGSIANGHACGVIGPSGAGKSSFLTALGGASSLHVGGNIWRLNADGNATTLRMQEGQVAYLQQHDSFFHMLTVRETLDLAAYLEFPTKSKAIRDDLVGRNLDALGLAKVANRPIGHRSLNHRGGLSGGERRRLSVGLELLSTPQVFLADESTTGLDSSQAVKIVKLIVNLAKQRQIPALLSLHQPRASIWKMLDSFILLAPGGRVCYAGPRLQALGYFKDLGYKCPEETNPAEFFIDLVSVDTENPEEARRDENRIEHLVQAFQTTQERKMANQMPDISNINGASVGLQGTPVRRFGALLLRSWRQNVRNTQYNLARTLACLGSSILFSQIFKSVREGIPYARSIADRTALLSFGVINMSMMALMKTVHLFSKERPVVDREQMRQQYSSLEYLLSKVIAEIPMDTLFASLFTTVLKCVTGLRISWTKLTATFAAMTAAGASLGFAIGSCSKDGDTAMATAMPVMVLFMVVGVINPSGVDKNAPVPLAVKLLKALSPIKWAIEGLLIGEFKDMDLTTRGQMPWQRIRDLPRFGAFAMVQNGAQILESLGLDGVTYDGTMKHLAVLSVANLLISWVGLEFNRTRRRQIKRDAKTTLSGSLSQHVTNTPQVLKVPMVANGL
jgi:ABC-type multidrug transport system ATPase subunit/ABC-type multidrug transport system permease subunit